MVSTWLISAWLKTSLASPIGGSEKDQAELSDALWSGQPTTAGTLAWTLCHVVRPQLRSVRSHSWNLAKVRSHKEVAEILLLHDYERPHTTSKTWEAITKFGWTAFPHLPYSLDLGRSDFHLFGALKDIIRGKRFGSNDGVTEEVKKRLRIQNSNGYQKGQMFWFLAAQGCWSWWRLCWKIRCVIQPSSYLMTMFKEL